jgi:MtN3 and saliva related transmembrane protein
MFNPEYVGFLAAFFTTSAFLTQADKILKTKVYEGLSLANYVVMAAGVLCWLLFGILIKSPSVIFANIISLTIVLFIIFFILKIK